MRLAIWSPLPPSPSGIADYVAEQLPALARYLDVTCVVEDPAEVDPGVADSCSLASAASPPTCDLDVYHLGNSPSHAYVYRAACLRPGVVVLHEWSLHHLVLNETVERGNTTTRAVTANNKKKKGEGIDRRTNSHGGEKTGGFSPSAASSVRKSARRKAFGDG